MSNKKQILAEKIVLIGLLLMGLFWAGTAVYTLFFSNNLYQTTSTKVVIGILSVGNAAGFGICALGLRKRFRLFFLITILFLTFNIILTFTDQFGILDFITGVIDVMVLIALIAWKRVRK